MVIFAFVFKTRILTKCIDYYDNNDEKKTLFDKNTYTRTINYKTNSSAGKKYRN